MFVVQLLAELEPDERAKVVRKVFEIEREKKRLEREDRRRRLENNEPMKPVQSDDAMMHSGG